MSDKHRETWGPINNERAHLIIKSIEGTATPDERERLGFLQATAFVYAQSSHSEDIVGDLLEEATGPISLAEKVAPIEDAKAAYRKEREKEWCPRQPAPSGRHTWSKQHMRQAKYQRMENPPEFTCCHCGKHKEASTDEP